MKTLLFSLATFALFVAPVFAQEGFTSREVEAHITQIQAQELLDGGVSQYEFTAQSIYGEIFEIDTKESLVAGIGYELAIGDRVRLQVVDTPDGSQAYFDDVYRASGVWWIVGLFTALILAIGLLRGALSLAGLCVTTVILLFWLFPAILAGADPVLTTVLASAVILGVNMHLSHGIKRQTVLAYLSTLGGLAAVVVLTDVFIRLARLSGLASEEGALLFWELDPVQVPVGILAAGIILGAVGVLDDVAVTQAEVIDELLVANPHTTRKELFRQGMRIGRHHIASTVNTLVLVYAGAALPTFLLFMNQFGGYGDFLGNELVVEELVRTLAGTCALVLTVPLSTWLATLSHPVVDSAEKGT